MNKTQINLNILLPSIPNEKDECVDRIIASLQGRRGIEKVHVREAKNGVPAQLCFHYDPSLISIAEIEKEAKQAGAELSDHYGHLLLEVLGVRQPRHARILESDIKRINGILNVSVSGTGFIQLEYEKSLQSENSIEEAVVRLGLRIKSVENFEKKPSPEAREYIHEEEKHVHGEEEHVHGGVFGERTEMIFAFICGAFLAVGFGLSFVSGISPFIAIGFFIVAYFFGGYYTTKEALESILKGRFEIDFLMLFAAVGAAFLGHWAEGALLLFLFSLGHSLEHYAMEKARKSIASLSGLTPKVALLRVGEVIKEVGIETLQVGDIILVRPNSTISADGIVIKGNSPVNQAPITGESMPVEKVAVEDVNVSIDQSDKLDDKYRVFAGTINGGQVLEIKVSKLSSNSTIARLVKLVNEAQTQKSPTQNFADKLEKYYVPAVLILVVALLFAFLIIDEPFSASFYRSMAVLVAASPCALAIATPSAVLSGVARAARGGVLIKGGRPLEELGAIKAIAFDKTGTLTEGKPKLTGAYPLNGASVEELLSISIAVEKLSDHPLAAAIVKGGMERLNREVPHASNVEGIIGRGVKAMYEGSAIYIGNKELFSERGVEISQEVLLQVDGYEQAGNTTMLVGQDDRLIGILTLMDMPRVDAKDTLIRLKALGIERMIMLTGDNQNVAETIAKEIGLTDAWGGLMPEQKVDAIEKLKGSVGKVAMLGDGVNDAPAMVQSNVGIAMGAAGSDVALETADIALMADKLSNLPFAIGLSKKASSIIKQNLVISMGMVIILVPLTLLGYASIGPAIIGHEGSTLVVVFNALRLLVYKQGA